MNSRQRAGAWPNPRHKPFSSQLRKIVSEWFKDNKFNTHPKMPYCLDHWDNWKNNIILPEVADYISTRKKEAKLQKIPFPLHRYLHHGMSSQALAFNLIGPLILRNDYSPFRALLACRNVPDLDLDDIGAGVFEYGDRKVFNEDAGQPTSFDFVLKGSSGQPYIFIECKFDEQEFGGCSVFSDGDCNGMNPIGSEKSCYLHHIGRKYWELMAKYKIIDKLSKDNQCIFIAYYQFFREVLFALENGGFFVVLSDERNPVFQYYSEGGYKGLVPFLTGLLPDQIRSRVVSVSIQDLVTIIEEDEKHSDWIFKFKSKYGLK